MAAPVLVDQDGTRWRDGKRYMWLTALVPPVLPIVSFGLWHRTGSGLPWWLTVMFVFGLLPLLDATTPKDPVAAPDWARPALDADRYYRWCTFLYLPLTGVCLVLGCWAWVHGELSAVERVAVVGAIGTVTGVGINTAHELGHKRDRLERVLAKVMLATTAYGHFYVEHNRGHHVRVATPADPASARLGESFWRFWPRTVLGSLRSAWELEARRLRLRGRSPWSVRNEVLTSWVYTVVLFGALAGVFGPSVLVFLVLQAVVGFSLLEAVNYVEHYGLARQRTATGRYEKVDPRHSWNSDDVISNLALYHLPRHSDHHANPTVRYQSLRSFSFAPQLPTGYGTMILASLVPRLWFQVMDPRVVAHYDGDVTRANLDPRRRADLVARFGGMDAGRATDVGHTTDTGGRAGVGGTAGANGGAGAGGDVPSVGVPADRSRSGTGPGIG
ncbi:MULTISPECIES: alkane 1-monooxygenase [unclassified Frankia]|uniref:alkane 1-monooxygenase n=1 Tax=unclassified Frankia TaxID=2632575 RepID=UPI000976C4BD|nr:MULTISPECIES: alkane 1-monooxygenase [unclassified Frankia]